MKLIDPSDYSFLGVNLFHFIVGLIGGVLRSLNNANQTVSHRILTAVAGAFAAGYLTPVVAPLVEGYVDHWGVSLSATSGLVGFLLGIGGLSVCEAVIMRFRKTFGA